MTWKPVPECDGPPAPVGMGANCFEYTTKLCRARGRQREGGNWTGEINSGLGVGGDSGGGVCCILSLVSGLKPYMVLHQKLSCHTSDTRLTVAAGA